MHIKSADALDLSYFNNYALLLRAVDTSFKKNCFQIIFFGGGGGGGLTPPKHLVVYGQQSMPSMCKECTIILPHKHNAQCNLSVIREYVWCCMWCASLPQHTLLSTTIAIVFYHINSPKPAVDPDIKPAKEEWTLDQMQQNWRETSLGQLRTSAGEVQYHILFLALVHEDNCEVSLSHLLNSMLELDGLLHSMRKNKEGMYC